jgi:hypothetical protein
MPVRSALLQSLQRIVHDASRATEADDRALEQEQPVFGRLLDASIPTFASYRRTMEKRRAAGTFPRKPRKDD